MLLCLPHFTVLAVALDQLCMHPVLNDLAFLEHKDLLLLVTHAYRNKFEIHWLGATCLLCMHDRG